MTTEQALAWCAEREAVIYAELGCFTIELIGGEGQGPTLVDAVENAIANGYND